MAVLLLEQGAVECRDLRSGMVRWTGKAAGEWLQDMSGLAGFDDAVVLAKRGEAIAFDLKDGRELWHNGQVGITAHRECCVAVIAGEDVVIVAYHHMQGPVVGLRATDGTQLWQYDPPEAIFSPPRRHGNTLLIHTEQRIVALDAGTGNIRWQHLQPVSLSDGAAVIGMGERAYAVSGTQLLEIDLAEGTVEAEQQLAVPLALWGPSVLADLDGLLAIASLEVRSRRDTSGTLYLYDPSIHQVVWSSPPVSHSAIGQVVADGKQLFYVNMSGIVAMELVHKDASP